MVSPHGYAEDWGGQYANSQRQDEDTNSQRQNEYAYSRRQQDEYAFGQRQDEEYGDDEYTLLWPWVKPLSSVNDRQETSVNRQSVSLTDPLLVAAVVGVALITLQLISLGTPLLSSVTGPTQRMDQGVAVSNQLRNHNMCGITTGGQEECYWDCDIVSSVDTSGQVVGPDLSCLLDCFQETTQRQGSDGSCIASLVRDVIEKKTCDIEGNPGTWGTTDSCTIEEPTCELFPGDNPDYPDGCPANCPADILFASITDGICSAETERLLATDECKQAIQELPGLLLNTVQQLIPISCVYDPFVPDYSTGPDYPTGSDYPTAPDYPTGSDYPSGPVAASGWRKSGRQDCPLPVYEDYETERILGKANTTRLAPVSTVVTGVNGYKTELDYTHTRHRYPWICSLRSLNKDPTKNKVHLCAVTLLSVPPQPTVVVGAAHCTYLCKDTDENGRVLPSCCCVTSTRGQESCAEDTVKCGIKPLAVEMDGGDAQIVCGEWQTGNDDQTVTEEKYNVVLPITEIIRHPNFDKKDEGPGAGSDIAIFKVQDVYLKMPEASRIYPACLPPTDRQQPKKGVHSGWTQPPPREFLQERAEGYIPHYADFFKQWHYNLDIQEKCKDPIKTQTFGLDLAFPSNSYYPPGTICARSFDRQSCFSTGDSGSPLMVKEEKRPGRLYAEGILSFVKGCDTFTLGNSNDERTEFQLTQFSENPATYTKLSCFLPWVARQYGLDYDGDPATDETCSQGSGQKTSTQPCRETVSNLLTNRDERECIFPFYFRDKLYNECVLFEEDNFVYPVFRCPVRNITTKRDGINDFGDPIGLTQGVCVSQPTDAEAAAGQLVTLDPAIEDCTSFQRVPPFSTCKNDCPGVRAFGIIGGGAILFAASGLGGLGTLAGGAGVVGAGGFAAQQTCTGPIFCRARRTNQCCMVIGTARGLRCPRSC